MNEIEITAHAPTREEAIAFLEAVNVATTDEQGNIIPISEVHIHPSRPEETIAIEGVEGFHFNLRFYGTSAETLSKPLPEGGWLPEHDIFDKTYINELVAQRTGEIPGWIASAEDPVPPGYAVNNVRAYDPALIATRANVWA